MLHIQIIVFALSLLTSTSFAVPLPAGGPEAGQVVSVAPSQTIGGNHNGPHPNKARPHIVLGEEHGTGNVVLAPVTAVENDPKLGPSVQHAEDYHDKLFGSIQLTHVTADPNVLPPPSYGGMKAFRGAVDEIKDKKQDAAIKVYDTAAQAHKAASDANQDAADAHNKAAKHWQKLGQAALAQEHKDKADQHEATAADMRTGKKDMARLAHNAEKYNDKMTHPDYIAAQNAKDGADQSRRNAEQSQEHAEAVVSLLKASAKSTKAAKKAGDEKTQQKLKDTAEHTAFQAAQHRPSNAAPPDVEKSEKLAKDSRKEARKVLKANK